MSGSVNKVILIGRVGKDPEVRTTQDGGKIINFSVATSETWKDKNTGERKEKTEWNRVVVFNDRIGEIVEKYVKKGSLIHVEGALQTRKWTDKTARNATQPKWSCKSSRARSRCSKAKRTAHPMPTGLLTAQRLPPRLPTSMTTFRFSEH